jgi:hypothetical protein
MLMDSLQNILIVDDNVKNIQLTANVLRATNLYNIFLLQVEKMLLSSLN